MQFLKSPPARVMPMSQIVSWILLITYGIEVVPFIAFCYWLWSLKNVKYGPQKQDPGIVSYFIVFFTWICTSNVIVRVISICFVLFHLSITTFMVLKARRQNKTLRFAQMAGLNDRWVQTFTYYTVVSFLFWILATGLTVMGYYGEEESAKLFGDRSRSHIPHAVA